ncbi:MAG: PASTA domain-containing protein [Clostridiales bacterium]|nr:PASTA domain-containing protein [Clostridiales bacterium]
MKKNRRTFENTKEKLFRNGIGYSNRIRLAGGFAFMLFLMILLIIRMGYWQIVRADDLQEKAISMQTVDTQINPVRGTIYDSKMNILAESVTEYELYGYTQSLYKYEGITETEKESTVKKLSEITGLDKELIKEKLESKKNLVLLADGLTKESVEKAQKLWDTNVVVKTKAARYYPNGAFAAQVMGGVNADNMGRTGLEYQYNSELSGVKGRVVRTTDRDGNTVAGGSKKSYDAQAGKSIVTTIDSVIQHYVEEALFTGMEKTGAEAITCIVMNPNTGDVLALASTPEYDPNNSNRPSDSTEYARFKNMDTDKQTEYLSKMWTVDAVSSIYEPGSTFKLITAAAALESGTANDNTTYYCNGKIHVGDYDLRCLGYHGTQTLNEAVGNSCNTAMAEAALDMGGRTFYNYIDLFGFNDKTGIDLPGETDSIVKDPNGMSPVDLATTGYGQGIAVTPLQILCAVNSFGNKGVIMKPKLVKKIVDADGKIVQEIQDQPIRQVVSESTAEKLCDIMECYVADASGSGAYVPGFRVGGKTGTANIVSGSTYSDATNTSFVAMAPMDDPQISIICIVYKPTKLQYGNFTAGPIVKEVMEKSLTYLGVERQYSKSEEEKAKKNMVKVPRVTGKDSLKAISILKSKNLNYTVMPESKSDKSFVVVDQYPKTGTKVDKGTTIYLYSE